MHYPMWNCRQRQLTRLKQCLFRQRSLHRQLQMRKKCRTVSCKALKQRLSTSVILFFSCVWSPFKTSKYVWIRKISHTNKILTYFIYKFYNKSFKKIKTSLYTMQNGRIYAILLFACFLCWYLIVIKFNNLILIIGF